MAITRQLYLIGIYQEGTGRIQVKPLDIIFHYIIIEAIVLPGVYRVKFIDLNESQAFERWLFRKVQSILLHEFLRLGIVPAG